MKELVNYQMFTLKTWQQTQFNEKEKYKIHYTISCSSLRHETHFKTLRLFGFAELSCLG